MESKYLNLGALLLLLNPGSIFLFLIFTILVNVYRISVIILAKWLQPELGNCMTGTTSLLAMDWFSKTPPRSNIIVTIYFRGIRTKTWAEEQVLRRWIFAKREDNGKPKYSQFKQYPFKWLGYIFWKNDNKFDISNHVFGCEALETAENELNQLTEKLLNEPYFKNRSPWEIHIIENFKTSRFHENVKSALVLKIHHCLGDGYSILAALIEGLFETSLSTLVLPKPRQEHKQIHEKVSLFLNFPLVLFRELFGMYQYVFEYSPWKVDDSDKKWHIICSQSELIPIENIKLIKNMFEVSFTSVLISAISAAIAKIYCDRKKGGEWHQNSKSLCLTTLPTSSGNKRDGLTNDVTAALFALPMENSCENPVERLKASHKTMEKVRNSVMPQVASIYTSILGTLFTKAAALVSRNQAIAISLTNFPTLPPNRKNTNIEDAVFAEFTAGTSEGVCGLGFFVTSCPPYVRIGLSAEKAVLSRKEASCMLKAVELEIMKLYVLSRLELNRKSG